ncbi:MAG TPA: hypothetical protein VJ914_19315 [Pseudonocardiaceae bacterium]|nr:hypothetical protein [Pseudonocardiaceae bacterium]
MTSMETRESARLLKDLARPIVGDCPDLKIQNSMIAALEEGIRKDGKFDKGVLFVGAFELPDIPDAGAVRSLLGNVKLIDLPSRTEARDGVPSHSLAANVNGFALSQAVGIPADLVNHSLLTMISARQLEYLHKSGFVGKEWKILVEIHYYRKRYLVEDILHKDTFGQTLFVNLNYDTAKEIPGPEYVLNPAVVAEHEAQIEESLPGEFMNDLRWVRGQLGPPTEIGIAAIKPYQFVAFVDEALHHMSPQPGGRTVTRDELRAFLAAEYGENTVKDASAARAAWRDANEGVGAFIKSFFTDEQPYSKFLTVIPANDAKLWFNLIELVETKGPKVIRANLLDAGLGDGVIDKLLNQYWPGYRNVTIPSAKEVPLADAPLKRQASQEALAKKTPASAPENRRFFRTWVRAVRA